MRIQADPPALPPPIYAAPPTGTLQQSQLLNCQCFNLPLSQYTYPTDNPTPPGDAFSTNFTGTLSPSSPAIADLTKQAGPGNAFVLQGGAFDSGSQIWCYTQTTATDGTLYTPVVKQAVPIGAPQTFTAIAQSTGNYGMTLAWVQNSDGSVSAPVRLNAPQVWWISQEQVGRGAALSLYGRNLSYRNGTTTSYVYVRPLGTTGTSTPCTITAVNPYRVDVKLPTTLTMGQDYEVWLHNGHGGIYGWSGPMRISIVSTDPNYGWTAATSTLTPGANIQTALNTAVAGQTVLLGSGTFTLTGPLTIPAGIQLAGAGQTSTYLQLATAYTGTGNVITMKPGRTRICDVTITTNGALFQSIIDSDGHGTHPMPKGEWIDRVTINYPCPPANGTAPTGTTTYPDGYIDSPAIELGNCEQSEVSACTITAGRSLFLDEVNGCNITSDHFNGNLPGQTSFGTLISGFAVHDVNITGNHFASVSRTVGASQIARRAVMIQDIDGIADDIYVSKNSVSGVGPMYGDGVSAQNVGETFCWEAAGQPLTIFTGSLTSPTAMTVSTVVTGSYVPWGLNALVTDDLTQTKSAIIAVNSGAGAGQWRKILSNGTNTLTIDRPWDVVPAASDTLIIEQASARVAVYDNNVYFEPDENGDGINDNIEVNRASVGCEFWGDVLDSDITQNIFQGNRIGVFNAGRYNSNTIEPQVGITVTGNTVADNYYGIFEGPYISQSGTTAGPDGPVLRNIMVRGNTVDNVATAGIYLDQSAADFKWKWGGWCENTMLDTNTFSETALPISMNVTGTYTQDTVSLP